MNDNKNNENPRRPLLARGELLKEDSSSGRKFGEKFHPATPRQAWASLAPMATAMAEEIAHLAPERCGRHIVFEATLRPNYLAPSYCPERVLAQDGLYTVGSRKSKEKKVTQTKVVDDAVTRTLLVAGSADDIGRFAARVARRPTAANEKDWDELRRFSSLRLPNPDSVIVRRPKAAYSGEDRITFEAVLSHVFDSEENMCRWADEHFRRFIAWVERHGGVVDRGYRRDLPGLTFVPLLASLSRLEKIADFNLLRAIRPMPEIAPFPDNALRMALRPPEISEAALDGEIPEGVVAVFDGGVNPNLKYFSPFVNLYNLTSEPEDPQAMMHGSMVTSALLYGSVEGPLLPNPTTMVDHYRVFPFATNQVGVPDHRLYAMLDQVTATLRAKDYSLVVLALGPNESVEEDSEPNRFTSELDRLAFEKKITFVTAVGNNGELDEVLGYDRVQPPGDMVNGIGVGAVVRSSRTRKKDLARACYSARGPGREGQRVQPMVVEFGGSEGEPFVGFDARGRLIHACGTSFAAPTAARALAGLQNSLDKERHRPQILRVFAVHFAERAHGHKKKLLDLGYGRVPETFERALSCDANEVTILYEDELVRGLPMALRFPLPKGLRDDTKLQIRWTLSYITDVDPREPTEYTLSGIEAKYRPDSRARLLTDAKTRESESVRSDIHSDKIQAALMQGCALSDEPLAKGNWCYTKTEKRLRQDGKWETVLCGSVKPTFGSLCEPRLDVAYLRRSGGRLVSGADVAPLPFAMLLTIRAPKGINIYDMVVAEYQVLAPLVRVPIHVQTVA